jgi:hypothetical protein
MTENLSSAELTARINNHLKRLAQLTDEAARSEAFKAYLQTCAKFHRYSPGNQMLISMFNPNATQVAGYKRWSSLKRYVKRGEHGIPILAPCVVKINPDQEDSPKTIPYFKIVYVFDVSQTEGEPLPEIEWRSPARLAQLDAALTAYAESLGIKVEIEDTGSAQGYAEKGRIALNPTAGTKTLIHELTHHLLHIGAEEAPLDRETREIEAEAAAYVVASHFNIPDLASPNYLALYDADEKIISARADRIRLAASQIINAVSPEED